MRTNEQTIKTTDAKTGGYEQGMDPEELWLDQDIDPEQLIRLDPLDITPDMVWQAEHPELVDPVLRSLPE